MDMLVRLWNTKTTACLALVVLCNTVAPVFAQTARAADPTVPAGGALNLTTSPLPVSLKTKPGTTVSTDLKVKNSGTSREHLRVDMFKFAAYGEEGKPRLLDPEPGDEYFSWVKFSSKVFDADPNEWKTIKMTINVPKSAAFGYYYAVTFSRAAKEDLTGEEKTAIKGATAVLVLLEADVPNAKRNVEVLQFGSKKGLYEFLPAIFNVKLKNVGNVHLAPRGNIFIRRGDKQIGTVEVNAEKGNILPASNRIFDGTWADGFPKYEQKIENGAAVTDKKSNPVMNLKWNLVDASKLRFGKYTADLLMTYDDGKRDVPIQASVSFWVIPWRILLGVVVVVGLLLAGAWSILRNMRRTVGKKRRR
jgi:hypothetical protein